MARFEVISPDGKKIEIEGEQFPTEKELDEIFKSFDNSDSGLSISPTKPATQKKKESRNYRKNSSILPLLTWQKIMPQQRMRS